MVIKIWSRDALEEAAVFLFHSQKESNDVTKATQ
jgi:hypothetical protein